MTGHAVKSVLGIDDPSGQEKEDRALLRKDRKEARELRDKTKIEKADAKKKLNKERLAALRARFSVSGGGVSKRIASNDDQGLSDAGDLFSRITGR